MTITVDLDGKGALVTGGTKGVGRGIAQRLADAGARIDVCARNPVDDFPEDWTFLSADIRDGEAAFATIDSVVEQLGSIDVLVEGVRQMRGTAPNQVPNAEHTLISAGRSGIILGKS